MNTGIRRLFAAAIERLAQKLTRLAQRLDNGRRVLSYARIDAPSGAAAANARGAHPNEHDTRAAERYVETIDPAAELTDPIVADTVRTLETVVAPRLGSSPSVLDYGCGSGRYGVILARPGSLTERWRYTGIERTEELAGLAGRALGGAQVLVTAGERAPCGDSSFDLVLASSVLQYAGSEWRVMLAELLRVSARMTVLSRVPLLRHQRSSWCRQTVDRGSQRERHEMMLIGREEFERELAARGAAIVFRDFMSEVFSVNGVSEPVVMSQYVIEMRKGAA